MKYIRRNIYAQICIFLLNALETFFNIVGSGHTYLNDVQANTMARTIAVCGASYIKLLSI